MHTHTHIYTNVYNYPVFCYLCRFEGATKIHFNIPKVLSPSIYVKFHAVLSKKEWFWDDSAETYICFSDPQLGEFSCAHGPMKVK